MIKKEMIMMNKNMIKTENWPICEMNVFPSTMDETRLWLEEMDMLLARRNEFVLIYPPVVKKEKPSSEDMQSMKYVRRWLKDTKEAMEQHCRALVVTLQPDGRDKEEMERMAPMLSALYGPQVLIAADGTTAKEQAQSVLA
ncbi:hypothetical protein J7T18_05030 [Providencia huaxiensis]|uniref:Uncharacterized protein n=2 Tax=Morganellaceae TaxID=1903414 RepID=A0A8I2D9I7_9GAMM|nr:hypothetical protein [Providencia huaxiensis]